MELLKQICLIVGAGVLGSLTAIATLYFTLFIHRILHKNFHCYRRVHGLILFPFSLIRVFFYKKETAIKTYGGWVEFNQNEKQIFEYRVITKLLKWKASIKDCLEYAEALNYLEQNKNNTVFCEDYTYRKGLNQTIKDYKNK